MDRQIQILNTLRRRGKETAANLACEFGVSVRTIMYDVEALSLNYPIIITRGRDGGISLSKGFVIDGYIMKREQLDLIVHGLHLLALTEPSYELESLIKLIEHK